VYESAGRQQLAFCPLHGHPSGSSDRSLRSSAAFSAVSGEKYHA